MFFNVWSFHRCLRKTTYPFRLCFFFGMGSLSPKKCRCFTLRIIGLSNGGVARLCFYTGFVWDLQKPPGTWDPKWFLQYDLSSCSFFVAQDRRKGSVTNVKGRLGLGGFLWIVCESMHVKQTQPPSNLVDGVNTYVYGPILNQQPVSFREFPRRYQGVGCWWMLPRYLDMFGLYPLYFAMNQ